MPGKDSPKLFTQTIAEKIYSQSNLKCSPIAIKGQCSLRKLYLIFIKFFVSANDLNIKQLLQYRLLSDELDLTEPFLCALFSRLDESTQMENKYYANRIKLNSCSGKHESNFEPAENFFRLRSCCLNNGAKYIFPI